MQDLVPSYTPSLYLPGSYGRYRQYPREVIAHIPGTGYDARQLVWGEQELNLDGRNKSVPQKYGWDGYDRVPLRGVGATDAADVLAMSSGWILAALAVGGLAIVAMRSKSAPAATTTTRRRSSRRPAIYLTVRTGSGKRRRRASKRRTARRSHS